MFSIVVGTQIPDFDTDCSITKEQSGLPNEPLFKYSGKLKMSNYKRLYDDVKTYEVMMSKHDCDMMKTARTQVSNYNVANNDEKDEKITSLYETEKKKWIMSDEYAYVQKKLVVAKTAFAASTPISTALTKYTNYIGENYKNNEHWLGMEYRTYTKSLDQFVIDAHEIYYNAFAQFCKDKKAAGVTTKVNHVDFNLHCKTLQINNADRQQTMLLFVVNNFNLFKDKMTVAPPLNYIEYSSIIMFFSAAIKKYIYNFVTNTTNAPIPLPETSYVFVNGKLNHFKVSITFVFKTDANACSEVIKHALGDYSGYKNTAYQCQNMNLLNAAASTDTKDEIIAQFLHFHQVEQDQEQPTIDIKVSDMAFYSTYCCRDPECTDSITDNNNIRCKILTPAPEFVNVVTLALQVVYLPILNIEKCLTTYKLADDLLGIHIK